MTGYSSWNLFCPYFIFKLTIRNSDYIFITKLISFCLRLKLQNMQNPINSTVFLPVTYTHNKNSNNVHNKSPKLPKKPSHTHLQNGMNPKPKTSTVHLEKLKKKSIKHKVQEKTGTKFHQNHKHSLQNRQNKQVFIAEKFQKTPKKHLLYVPGQKENLDIQVPATMVQKGTQQQVQQASILVKKRLGLNKTVQRSKQNSFVIKKSLPFVKRDLSLTLKSFIDEKEQLKKERRNQQQEEFYYVGELKRQMRKLQDFVGDLHEQIPVTIGHFFQTVSTFFKYKDLQAPEECKISVYLGKQRKVKTTLIFDMDQTLIHAEPYIKQIHENSWGQNIQIMIDDRPKILINLKIRPHAKQVLERLKQKYEIGVFTAANEIYAKQILRKIDPEGKIFDFELFRQHCDVIGGKLAVKDLRILSNRSIKNVILVDNSPHTYLYQKENAVPIVSFHDDLGDTQLLKLEQFIEAQAFDKKDDVREVLTKVFKFPNYTEFSSLEELMEELY